MTDHAAPSGVTTQTPPPDPKKVRRAAWAGLVGTALEQYDFVIYGTASALIFGELFFPGVSPAAGVMASFSAYAVGFLARPVGGLFFSHFGEKLGRKWVLVTTLFLMGTATFLIGCLPTFESIGLWAPLLLVALRFLQGFGAGAEQAGGATLLTETAQLGRRGRLSSFVMVGAAIGTALGAIAWVAAQRLPDDQLMTWGWRAIFWSSLIVTIGAYIIRRKLAESPVFVELKNQVDVEQQVPLKEVAKHGTMRVLKVGIMNLGPNTQSYTYQVFLASYLVTVVKVDETLIPKVLLLGAVAGALSAFAFGSLSDRFGRKALFTWLAVACLVVPVPGFFAMTTGSTVAIIVVMVLGFVTAAYGIAGVTMSYFPELFGSRYRYAGVTIGREFSAVLGGGVAPLIATALLGWFADSWVPVAIYMIVTMLASLLVARTVPETVNRDLQPQADAQDGEARMHLTEADVRHTPTARS